MYACTSLTLVAVESVTCGQVLLYIVVMYVAAVERGVVPPSNDRRF